MPIFHVYTHAQERERNVVICENLIQQKDKLEDYTSRR